MANIKEFKGVRPRKDLAEKIAELPYDVVNSKEARKIAGGNELNFYHIALPEVDFPEDSDPSAEEIYLKGKENLISIKLMTSVDHTNVLKLMMEQLQQRSH